MNRHILNKSINRVWIHTLLPLSDCFDRLVSFHFLLMILLLIFYGCCDISWAQYPNSVNDSCRSNDGGNNMAFVQDDWENNYSNYVSTSVLEEQRNRRESDDQNNGGRDKHSGAFPLVDYKHWEEHDVQEWKYQIMPLGLIYPSYLAGRKEPRLGCVFTNEQDYGWLWDIQFGGRVPLFRYGTTTAIRPEGFQIDMEGAALLRLDFERHSELAGTDYRAGLPVTYGTKHWQYKLAYYHVSSHLGDNYLMADYRKRVQYVRDEIVVGTSWRPIDSIRFYGEIGWAFHKGDTTEPWELQFGAEYSAPYQPNHEKGSPFFAINGHLFEELNFGGYLNIQVGWQWRNPANGLFRLGLEYYDGCDDLFQFHKMYQRKIGGIISYDF